MANVKDVAQYILERKGEMTTWKLQKLDYYCQAWTLVWDEEKLFSDRIEAWSNGPVIRNLYDVHSGMFQISSIPGGDSSRLNTVQRETIDAVLLEYGALSSWQLRNLTHEETPWKETRLVAGLDEGERGNVEIPTELMADYYGSL